MVFVQTPTLKLERNLVGQVNAAITVTNHIDQILAERGFIDQDEVRSIELSNVLVDTGATTLCLPTHLLDILGLPLDGTTELKTAAGVVESRLFKEANLTVCGRQDTFKCLELTSIDDPLLGVIPLEALGLEPDLQNQQLRVLPDRGKKTYFTAL